MLQGHESIENGHAFHISLLRQVGQGMSANTRCFAENLHTTGEISEAIPNSSLHRGEGRQVVLWQLPVFWFRTRQGVSLRGKSLDRKLWITRFPNTGPAPRLAADLLVAVVPRRPEARGGEIRDNGQERQGWRRRQCESGCWWGARMKIDHISQVWNNPPDSPRPPMESQGCGFFAYAEAGAVDGNGVIAGLPW